MAEGAVTILPKRQTIKGKSTHFLLLMTTQDPILQRRCFVDSLVQRNRVADTQHVAQTS